MKKIFSLILTFAITGAVLAQADVVSAYQANQKGEYAKAAGYIDNAIEHPKAVSKEKTWRYRGDIYSNIAMNPELMKDYPDALFIARDSYLKAIELDERGSYEKESKAGLDRVRQQAMNKGVDDYNAENFGEAGRHFMLSSNLTEYFGTVDTTAIFNAAISYEKAEMYDQAIEQYLRCGELEYNTPAVYLFASYLYKRQDKNEEAKKLVMEARQKYPDDKDLIIEELNYYLESGNDEEALKNLDLAIQKDPENKVLHFAMGTIYDKMGQSEKAIASYESALALDANYFDALYNLGAFYFNEGVSKVNAANEIESNTKYQAAIDEANEIFAKGIPYLEQAHQLKPEDKDTLRSLKDAYARVGDDEKYNDVKEKLDALN